MRNVDKKDYKKPESIYDRRKEQFFVFRASMVKLSGEDSAKQRIYVTTCWSGEVDDSDLTYTGAHPLGDVLGIRTEEIDAPGGYCENSMCYHGTDYRITGLCGLVHADGAKVLAEFASVNEGSFLRELYAQILKERGLGCGLQVRLAEGVTVNERSRAAQDGGQAEKVWFLQNYNREPAVVELLACYEDVETGERLAGRIELPSFACMVLTEHH